MKKITILIVLLILARSEDEQVEVADDSYEDYDEAEQYEEEQDEYFHNYTTFLDGFVAQQTFLMRLAENQTSDFMVSIAPNSSTFRGLFYADTQNEEDTRVEIWHQNTLLEAFDNRRMHIMHVKEPKEGYLTVRTINKGIQKYVYYSFQVVSSDKPSKPAISQQFRSVHSHYQHIAKSIAKRQFMLQTLIRQNRYHMEKLHNNRQRTLHLALFQTIILVSSCLLSLYMLYSAIKRQSQFVI